MAPRRIRMVRPSSSVPVGFEADADAESESESARSDSSTDDELLAFLRRVERSVQDRRLEARHALEVVNIVSDLLVEPGYGDRAGRRRT